MRPPRAEERRHDWRVKFALSIPPFGALADPSFLVEAAIAAEEQGLDGIFLWDHVLRPESDPKEILDPWVTLGAQAHATSRIRLGPMVTPLTRRRPIKLAREVITVDHLSAGRLILGLGLGVDSGGELSRFGEIIDAKERGDRLDEGIEVLTSMWSGEPVNHDGAAYLVDDVTVLPRPVQLPRIPLWFAARGGSAQRPIRRAARYDGMVPIEVDGGRLSEMLDVVIAQRGSLDGFDTMVSAAVAPAEAERRGATWSYRSMATNATPDHVFDLISRDPTAES